MTQRLHLRPLDARTWARLAGSDRIPPRSGRPVDKDDLQLALWLLGATVQTPKGHPPPGTWRLRPTLGDLWVDVAGDIPTPPDRPVDLRFGAGSRKLLLDIAATISALAGPQALTPANDEGSLHPLWADDPKTLLVRPERWQHLCAARDLLEACHCDVQYAHFTADERTLDVIIDRAPERALPSFWVEAVFARSPHVCRPWPRILHVGAAAWTSAPLDPLRQTIEATLHPFVGAAALAGPYLTTATSGVIMLQDWDLRAWLISGERRRIALFWETSA